jgi:hypothetical protein
VLCVATFMRTLLMYQRILVAVVVMFVAYVLLLGKPWNFALPPRGALPRWRHSFLRMPCHQSVPWEAHQRR